jgi:nucleolar protein 56
VEKFCDRVISLAKYRHDLALYLHEKMLACAPSLTTLVGDYVGARLISHAGSLTNLAKAPASTVQILGAEKALFRALKTKTNTPKYGLIFHSSFIGKAKPKDKGRISRYLANKCSLASRIDAFSDIPSGKFGELLRDQVEGRLAFYESGAAPRKNIEVMQEGIKLVAEEQKEMEIEASQEEKVVEPTPMEEAGQVKSEKKKKKKKRTTEEVIEEEPKTPVTEKKKKTKKGKTDEKEVEETKSAKKKKGKTDEKEAEEPKSAKKKKGKTDEKEAEEPKSAKKKSKKRDRDGEADVEDVEKSAKKKKKHSK